MKLAISDLEMVLKWVRAHSPDITVQLHQDVDMVRIRCSDRSGAIVLFELFSAEGNSMARVTKSSYLRHEFPKSEPK